MSKLAEIILCICVSGVVSGVIYILAPSGSGKKIMRCVTGIFILGCIILPLLNLDVSELFSNMQFEGEENSTVSELNYTLKGEYEYFLTSDIEKCLLNEGVTVKSVEVQYEGAQDKAEIMHITKILVYTSGPINKNKYENLLKELYGTDVSILREEVNQKEN